MYPELYGDHLTDFKIEMQGLLGMQEEQDINARRSKNQPQGLLGNDISTSKYLEIPESTSKYHEVPQSTQMYLKVPTYKYLSTPKYPEVAERA